MSLYTDLSAEQAREEKAHFRDFEKRKYDEVYKALLDVIAECDGDLGKLTQDAVRLKTDGKSPGTVKKYLRIAWACWKAEFEKQQSGNADNDPWPALTSGARQLFQAVSDFVNTVKDGRASLEADLHAQMASAMVAQEGRLREETQRRVEAEQAVLAVAAESDQRAASLEELAGTVEVMTAANQALSAQLTTLQHELELAEAKAGAAEAGTAACRRAELDLRGDLDAARLELAAERKRLTDVLATLEETIQARESDGIRARAELEELRRQQREELGELRRQNDDALAAMRDAQARDLDVERKRNAELAFAITEALKAVGKPIQGGLQ